MMWTLHGNDEERESWVVITSGDRSGSGSGHHSSKTNPSSSTSLLLCLKFNDLSCSTGCYHHSHKPVCLHCNKRESTSLFPTKFQVVFQFQNIKKISHVNSRVKWKFQQISGLDRGKLHELQDSDLAKGKNVKVIPDRDNLVSISLFSLLFKEPACLMYSPEWSTSETLYRHQLVLEWTPTKQSKSSI